MIGLSENSETRLVDPELSFVSASMPNLNSTALTLCFFCFAAVVNRMGMIVKAYLGADDYPEMKWK